MKAKESKPVRAKLQKRRSINEILREAYQRFTSDQMSLQAMTRILAS